MFPFLTKRAASAAAILALTGTLGLTAIVETAQARPIYMKIKSQKGGTYAQDEEGAAKAGKPAGGPANGAVCCVKPRSEKPVLLKPAECRAAKGKVVAPAKCAPTLKEPGKIEVPNIKAQ